MLHWWAHLFYLKIRLKYCADAILQGLGGGVIGVGEILNSVTKFIDYRLKLPSLALFDEIILIYG